MPPHGGGEPETARGGEAEIIDTAMYGRILAIEGNAGAMLGPMAQRNADEFGTYTAFAPGYLMSDGYAGVLSPEKKAPFMSAAGVLRIDGTTLHEIKHMQDDKLLADGRITPAHGTLSSTGSAFRAATGRNTTSPSRTRTSADRSGTRWPTSDASARRAPRRRRSERR